MAITKSLEGGKIYYLQAIASSTVGSLKISLNAKMYNTTLNGKMSAMIKTEEQVIEINSTVVQETNVSAFKIVKITSKYFSCNYRPYCMVKPNWEMVLLKCKA